MFAAAVHGSSSNSLFISVSCNRQSCASHCLMFRQICFCVRPCQCYYVSTAGARGQAAQVLSVAKLSPRTCMPDRLCFAICLLLCQFQQCCICPLHVRVQAARTMGISIAKMSSSSFVFCHYSYCWGCYVYTAGVRGQAAGQRCAGEAVLLCLPRRFGLLGRGDQDGCCGEHAVSFCCSVSSVLLVARKR